MKYLLDSNIFIEPKKQFYVFDICPDYWTWLKTCKELSSIEKVREEIFQGNDDLVSWVKDSFKREWFLKYDDIVTQKNYSRIADYVNGLKNHTSMQKGKFLNGADGWLIATAMKQNDIIVTLEKSHSAISTGKIFLPDIAKQFDIKCITLYDLLRRFNIKFVIDPAVRSDLLNPSQDDDFHLSPG